MKLSFILKKYISIIIGVLFFTVSSYGGTSANSGLACPADTVTDANRSAVWECPDLPNLPAGVSVTKEIASIDFFSGGYVCDYLHDSGAVATSCNFKSQSYVDAIKETKTAVIGDALSNDITKVDGKVDRGDSLSFDTDMNKLGVTLTSSEQNEIKIVEKGINSVIKTLKETKNTVKTKGGELSNVETSLKVLQTTSYKHLIEPYVGTSSGDIVKKDNNFALFLAGLVTLDPDIVTGYDEHTGKMKISRDWRTKATTISRENKDFISRTLASGASAWHSFTSLFGDEAIDSESTSMQLDDADQYVTNLSSWVDVFEMKLWGFYYHLNQRLDLGYDIISTQLLSIMMVWFMLAAGTKGGITYILNKEGVAQQVQPAMIKTLTTLLAVGAFYVSLSTPAQVPNYVTTDVNDFPQEMQKNRTMMKWLIRYSSSEGSKMATMISDLGLDAFLTFIVKKQQVFSGRELSAAFETELIPFIYYYPAMQIIHECRNIYDQTDMEFVNAIDSSELSKKKNYSSAFLTKTDTNGISFNTCKTAYKIAASSTHDIVYTMAATRERIKNIDATMAKSVEFLVRNNIMLQDKMGWINSFGVPISYFMMKNNDMFLSPSVDMDAIEKEAEKFTKSMGYADGGSVSDAIKKQDAEKNLGFFAKMARDGRRWYNEATDSGGKIIGQAAGYMNSFLLYSSLPGFNTIRTGIYTYLDDTYDKLYEGRKDDKDLFKKMLSGVKTIPTSPAGVVFYFVVESSKKIMEKPIIAQALIFLLSFLLAYTVWKTTFMIMFISSISIMILLKIVIYYKDLLIHTFISVFVVVWAFASSQSGGQRMTNYLRDTMILMMFPTMIVMSTYIFIFVSELFQTLYIFIMKTMIGNQEASISLMGQANNDTDSMASYFTLYMMGEFSQILIYVFMLVIAYTTIIQLPEFILKKLGMQDSSITNITQTSEKMINKGERTTNPLMQ